MANFVMPRSGGLRTALQEVGHRYLPAGHEPVLIIPGRLPRRADLGGSRHHHPGPVVPGTGGYRVLLGRRRLGKLLEGLGPTGWRCWTASRSAGPAAGPGPARPVGHGLAREPRLAAGLRRAPRRPAGGPDERPRLPLLRPHRVHHRVGGRGVPPARGDNLARVPLGVDLDLFIPFRYQRVRARFAAPGQVLLVHCGRLSSEKRPVRRSTRWSRCVTRRRRGARGGGRRAPARPAAPAGPRPRGALHRLRADRTAVAACSRPPTWSWRRARSRHSGWPRWRRWRAARR